MEEQEFFASMAGVFQHALKKLSAKGATAIHDGMTKAELDELRKDFKKASDLIKGVFELLKINAE